MSSSKFIVGDTLIVEEKEGLVKEIRQRQFYEKPSDKRVRKNKEMAAAWKKKQKKLKAQRGF